jgi:hypothetical protein
MKLIKAAALLITTKTIFVWKAKGLSNLKGLLSPNQISWEEISTSRGNPLSSRKGIT